jgi:hypothetical protein
MPEQRQQWRLDFVALKTREGRRREWVGEVWTTAEIPFKVLGSWPRRQVACGA